MKTLKALALVAGMTMVVNAATVQAQDGAKKGNKEGKGARKGQRGGQMQAQFKRIEDVLGKPLTQEQKTAITEAQKTYQESLAKAVGMTVAEWNAKQKEFREKNRANGGANAGGAKKDGA